MNFKRFFSALFCIFLLTTSAFAGDIETLFTHNEHDALIVGEVTDIKDGIATVKAVHHIVSKLPEGSLREQQAPSEIKIKANYTCFGFIGENTHENKVGDYVVMDVNKNGDLWELATASYLVDSLDYEKLNILLPSKLQQDAKDTAAAHTLFIKSFINSDGASVPEAATFENVSELKSKHKNGDFIYFSNTESKNLSKTSTTASQVPKPDYSRLYIVTGCGILFILLMLLYRKMK